MRFARSSAVACGMLAMTLTAGAAFAATTDQSSMMMPAKIDCTKAEGMMSQAAAGPMPTSAPGAAAMSTDAMFAADSHAMMEHAKMMAHIEMACGKDAAKKKMAQELLDRITDYEAEAARVRAGLQ